MGNRVNRRRALQVAVSAVLTRNAWAKPRELNADLAIIGGSTGGCAAALAALRNGLRVILTEETQWIGGQLTSQMVPPDEHPWVEQFGGTRTYREYRNRVRAYYREHYPLTPEARGRWNLNPGDGLVSRITHEPRVSLAVLEAMLAPYLTGGQLTLLVQHKPVKAEMAGDRMQAVGLRGPDGVVRTVTAKYFIDGTEMGDLLPLAKVEYVTGAESQRQTGEPHAPSEPQPANHQAFTVCFAIEASNGEDHTIDKPAEYAFWRDYVPAMKPAWPGKLLGWSMSNPITLAPRAVTFDPTETTAKPGPLNLWLYRRILNKANFAPGAVRGDVSLINWPQNDYWLGNLYDVPEAEAAKHLERGKQLSLSLLYWMQTEAPRPDGKQGWPQLRLRYDMAGTQDGLAMYPYIRESRRIQAEFTVLEQHVGADARAKLLGRKPEEVTAEAFADSLGVGSYRIDLHPSSGGDNYIDVASLPFQIPMGALLPKRVENLLAGCKNLGVTHITNGCYRLHPVEWNIGEAAGMVAAEAVRTGEPPRKLRNDGKRLQALQARCREQGIETEWPRLRPL